MTRGELSRTKPKDPLLPSVSCLLSSVFCLPSSVFRLLSSVSCLLSPVVPPRPAGFAMAAVRAVRPVFGGDVCWTQIVVGGGGKKTRVAWPVGRSKSRAIIHRAG